MATNFTSNGIDFGASGNQGGMTSEVLDDYEEGTWTITNNGGAVTINSQNSVRFTVCGRIITLNNYVALAGDGDGNPVTWGGMPGNSLAYDTCIVNNQSGLAEFIILRTNPNSAVMNTYKANQNAVNENEIDATHWIFTLTYEKYQ